MDYLQQAKEEILQPGTYGRYDSLLRILDADTLMKEKPRVIKKQIVRILGIQQTDMNEKEWETFTKTLSTWLIRYRKKNSNPVSKDPAVKTGEEEPKLVFDKSKLHQAPKDLYSDFEL